MTVVAGSVLSNAGIEICPTNRTLNVNGQPLLTFVPQNVSLTPSSTTAYGAFIGASSVESNSRLVLPLGVFKDLRFMCCFRYTLWWMTQRMGSSGREVPTETQFMLVELPLSTDAAAMNPTVNNVNVNASWQDSTDVEQNATIYVVLLPLLEGSFRACLQGNESNDYLELCLESGDVAVEGSGGLHSVFIHSGTNPFQVIAEAVQSVEKHLQTFSRREKKKMPEHILDWFGWCTWDAFYTNVTADGVRQGLKSLEEGGAPARFVIIDDGWQCVSSEKSATQGIQDAKRLSDVKENFKFLKNGKEGAERHEDPGMGIQHLVKEIKATHKLKSVYVWHAITGYWGGIMPTASEMEKYEASLQLPVHSLGLLNNHPSIGVDHLTINGFGLAHPSKVFQFYNDLHKHLAGAGIDGVKVDVQNILETLGTGTGGRVSITQRYQQALEESVAQNFPGNGCIACMSHNTDALYNAKRTAVVRASDDFYPRDPASHTIHIGSVSYNSVFLGEFMQPDWDMFHSLHPVAEYHAAARSVGGCPVYVSDKPGNHNFELLKKLVLPDGSILRAQLPGRPTRDCLFTDPTRDGKSLLKIWNQNKYTGVIGAFNCQGASWCKLQKKTLIHDPAPQAVGGTLYARDVESFRSHVNGLAPASEWDGNCVVYSHKSGELVSLSWSAGMPIKLNPLEYNIYTISPVKRLPSGEAFAPIGLLEMFNSGGAILGLEYMVAPHVCVKMQIHGCGIFGAYASQAPKQCLTNDVVSKFYYNEHTHLFKVSLPQTQDLWHEVKLTF